MFEAVIGLATSALDHGAWTLLLAALALVAGVCHAERDDERAPRDVAAGPAEQLQSWTRGTR